MFIFSLFPLFLLLIQWFREFSMWQFTRWTNYGPIYFSPWNWQSHAQCVDICIVLSFTRKICRKFQLNWTLSFSDRPRKLKSQSKMLFSAWPIGGIKHSSLQNQNEKGGKCRFIILCSCYGLFLIIGAAIFSVIEAPQLDKYNRELIDAKDKFAQRNPCLNRKSMWFNCESSFCFFCCCEIMSFLLLLKLETPGKLMCVCVRDPR